MEPLYIGVDLHSRFFQACAVDPSGTRQWEGRFERTSVGVSAFQARCRCVDAIAVEASTPTWHFVDWVQSSVDRVVVVDAFRTRLKAGYAAKTDRLDARRLADALRRDSVVGIYVPPLYVREWRELCRHRQTVVRTKRALIQRLRAVLLRQGIVEHARLRTARGLSVLDRLVLSARASEAVTQLRALIVALDEQGTRGDAAVAAEVQRDAVSQALLTIRGIGPILGLTIRSEIGSIHRFPSPRELASYAGLVPRVEASAGRIRYGRITRRGSPWLRWALVEAAIHRIKQADATGAWGRRLAGRKGALKARVAMARRLCEEIWGVWHGIDGRSLHGGRSSFS